MATSPTRSAGPSSATKRLAASARDGRAGADVALIHHQHDQPPAGRGRVRAVVGRRRRRLLPSPAAHTAPTRSGRLAVDGQREIVRLELGRRPAGPSTMFTSTGTRIDRDQRSPLPGLWRRPRGCGRRRGTSAKNRAWVMTVSSGGGFIAGQPVALPARHGLSSGDLDANRATRRRAEHLGAYDSTYWFRRSSRFRRTPFPV